MNTNIKSAALSLGKQRLISAQCQEILATLQKTVQTQGNFALPRSKKRDLITTDQCQYSVYERPAA